MSRLKRIFARTMKRMRENACVNALAQYLYLKTSLVFMGQPDSQNELLFGRIGADEGPKVAFLCDEMTWQDYRGCCNAIFLHPKIWKKQLEIFKPDLFFCESAWSGIEAFAGVWRGRVYRERRVSFENRDVLQNILAYCRENGISSAFWNKEDPTYFNHEIYDFVNTALQFDFIFTTAQECIAHYQHRGHKKVYLLPFGVNMDMFYPAKESQRKNAAVFAGSWFGDHPKRCQELAALLDYALEQNWDLTIYDRMSAALEARYRFPEKYAPYIRPAVPFSKMPEICRQYEYAINVNTVVDSETMISRRVLQLAASGVVIVSNETLGFHALQDCLKIRKESGMVFAESIPGAVEAHSTARRFKYVLKQVGIV